MQSSFDAGLFGCALRGQLTKGAGLPAHSGCCALQDLEGEEFEDGKFMCQVIHARSFPFPKCTKNGECPFGDGCNTHDTYTQEEAERVGYDGARDGSCGGIFGCGLEGQKCDKDGPPPNSMCCALQDLWCKPATDDSSDLYCQKIHPPEPPKGGYQKCGEGLPGCPFPDGCNKGDHWGKDEAEKFTNTSGMEGITERGGSCGGIAGCAKLGQKCTGSGMSLGSNCCALQELTCLKAYGAGDGDDED